MKSTQRKILTSIKESFSLDDSSCFHKVLSFIHATLSQLGMDKKQRIKTELLCEETITQLMEHSGGSKPLHIQVKKNFGTISVNLRMQGEEFDISSYETLAGMDPEEDESQEAIRAIVMKAYGENFKYSHKKKENCVRIVAEKTGSSLCATLFAMVFGVLLGLAIKFFSSTPVVEAVYDYMLSPFKTMFMSALKMVIAPVVFFSIVTCFSQYDSVSEFGRLGAKVMSMYILTTVLAVVLSMGVAGLWKFDEFGFALAGRELSDFAVTEAEKDTSFLGMIVHVVPNNFLSPFLESDTLQLMFLAVIVGVALGMIGEHTSVLRELFEALNSLFLMIMSLIVRLIPLVVFCSIATMVIDIQWNAFLSLLSLCAQQIFTVGCMLCIYGVLILLLGRLNPFKFYKKAQEGMLTSFTLSSSSAAMPTNLRVCTEKLGISPKICNFSIPLGATVNMDGACIFMMGVSLFLARAYGVTVQSSQMISLVVTIILLSLGAPGVPGASFICLGVVLRLLNVPTEAIGLMLAVYPILDMFDTMLNTTGDMTAALIVAKSENLLDMKKYEGRSG